MVTADQINDHLAAGGRVVIGTYTRSTVYGCEHSGCFETGQDGNLYVRHGRSIICLTMLGGEHLLVKIKLSK